jgi:nucleoside-diphosphate-sugar epimerase
MRVAVTGGAGYIGSVVAEVLLQHGHDVLVLDNLAKGHRDAIPESTRFERSSCSIARARSSISGVSEQRPSCTWRLIRSSANRSSIPRGTTVRTVAIAQRGDRRVLARFARSGVLAARRFTLSVPRG